MEERRLLQGIAVIISVALAYSETEPDHFLDMPKHCHMHKPTAFNYTPKGVEYEIGNLTIYDTDNRSAGRLVIAVYDIFGPSNQIKEICDTLAELYDFRVVMPDFFRGFPWDLEDIPPSDPEQYERWYNGNASWENVVKWDVRNVIDHFEASEAAIFGMCYGGRISTLAASEFPEVKAGGLVHPSRVGDDLAADVKAPLYLLPGKDDPNYDNFLEVLREKFGDNCGHRRFDDMDHGFAGAQGNFSDPKNMMRVNEVIYILGGFFGRNLRN